MFIFNTIIRSLTRPPQSYISLQSFFNQLSQIEQEPSSLVKSKILSDLLTSADSEVEVKQILNFCLCEPDLSQKSDRADIIVSENVIQSALSRYLNIPLASIKINEKQYGDLSDYAYHEYQQKESNELLTLSQFFSTINEISQTQGFGSESIKEIQIQQLFQQCQSQIELKFIIRFLKKKMRIGFNRGNIEKLLKQLGQTDKQKYNQIQIQVLAYSNQDLQVGVPILSTLAQSFDSTQSIEDEFKDQDCYCEQKYDGERIQVHFNGHGVELFSRSMEKRGWKYPLLVQKLETYFKTKSSLINGIFDCEMICFDQDGQVVAFQEMQSSKKITSELGLMCFDVLYYNNEPQIQNVLKERQNIIQSLFTKQQSYPIHAVESVLVEWGQQGFLQKLHQTSLEQGLEGIMVKRNVPYKPGSRTDWAKLKVHRDMDLALIGAYWGRGKRSQVLGAFLLGALDTEHGHYNPLTKIGTGFSNITMADITERVRSLRSDERPKLVTSLRAIQPDVWIQPHEIWEVRYDSISISPKYQLRSSTQMFQGGLSLRFPRFVRQRLDKNLQQCTTVDEVLLSGLMSLNNVGQDRSEILI